MEMIKTSSKLRAMVEASLTCYLSGKEITPSSNVMSWIIDGGSISVLVEEFNKLSQSEQDELIEGKYLSVHSTIPVGHKGIQGYTSGETNDKHQGKYKTNYSGSKSYNREVKKNRAKRSA